MALARAQRPEEARSAFSQGLASYPNDKRFPIELAGLAYRRKENGEAIRLLTQGLRVAPEDEYANDFLATLYQLDGNLPAALKYWNRVGKPLIQDFRISPPMKLDPILRERTFAISAGQVLTTSRLQTTESNLRRLAVLSAYQFELAPRQDGRFGLIFHPVSIAEPTSGWLGRILPLVRGLPYQAIHFDRANLAEKAINLKSLWRWDPNKRRIALTVSEPFRVDPRLKLSVTTDIRDEHWDLNSAYTRGLGTPQSFVLRKYEAGVQMETGLTGALQWTSGFTVSRRSFRQVAATGPFAGGWSLQWPNRFSYSLWNIPERRIRVDADVLLSPGRASEGSSRFLTTTGSLAGTWFPQAKGDKVLVTARVQTGKIFGSVPFDQYFMLGMERDNTLWLRGHVATRDGKKGNAPLGTAYTLVQTEIDRTIFRLPFLSVQCGPFYDAGWIADSAGRFGSQGWMHDAGIQVKFKTFSAITWTLVYGRDLRRGGGAFYTAVSP
jgi:hypothetical protein